MRMNQVPGIYYSAKIIWNPVRNNGRRTEYSFASEREGTNRTSRLEYTLLIIVVLSS